MLIWGNKVYVLPTSVCTRPQVDSMPLSPCCLNTCHQVSLASFDQLEWAARNDIWQQLKVITPASGSYSLSTCCHPGISLNWFKGLSLPHACTSAKLLQLCSTVCCSMDYSPPGSSVHGIFQARILEWVTIPFSKRSSWPWHQTWFSCIAGGFFTIWATRKTGVWHMTGYQRCSEIVVVGAHKTQKLSEAPQLSIICLIFSFDFFLRSSVAIQCVLSEMLITQNF